jgi:glycosyltransferase involved in cell wall biosynthesis
MLNLAEELVARGIAVDLLIAAPDGVARDVPAGVRVVDLGRRARHGLGRAVTYLRREQPDAIISARNYVNLLMLAAHRIARSEARLIWTFHTHRSAEIARANRMQRLWDRLVLHFIAAPDARVAVSEGVAADLRAALRHPPQIDVILNPAWSAARAAQTLEPCPHPWLAARSPWPAGATPDPGSPAPVLVAMGRLAVQKDFPTLLRAFAQLRQTRPLARLILLGEGPERENLTRLCADLGLRMDVDVALPGHVAAPLAFLSRADLFVLSSLWEGLPMVLVEALGAGLRIVSTYCPSGPDEVLAEGRLGLLVPPGDPAALAQAMGQALDQPADPARQIAAAARFSAHLAAAAYLHIAFAKLC